MFLLICSSFTVKSVWLLPTLGLVVQWVSAVSKVALLFTRSLFSVCKLTVLTPCDILAACLHMRQWLCFQPVETGACNRGHPVVELIINIVEMCICCEIAFAALPCPLFCYTTIRKPSIFSAWTRNMPYDERVRCNEAVSGTYWVNRTLSPWGARSFIALLQSWWSLGDEPRKRVLECVCCFENVSTHRV